MTLQRSRASGRASQYSVTLRRKLPENLGAHNAAGASAIMAQMQPVPALGSPSHGANADSQSRTSAEALVQHLEEGYVTRETLEQREMLKQMQLRLNAQTDAAHSPTAQSPFEPFRPPEQWPFLCPLHHNGQPVGIRRGAQGNKRLQVELGWAGLRLLHLLGWFAPAAPATCVHATGCTRVCACGRA